MKNKFILNNQPKDLIRQNSDVNFELDNTKTRQMREMKSLSKHFEPKKKHFFFQQGQKIVGDYRFDPKKEIGNGYSSKVYKAMSIKDNQEYAIKALQLNNFKPSQFEMLQNEIRILKKVSHPNVIKFYSVSKTKTHLYIVTEFCSKGDLLTYMTRKGILSEKEALQIFTDIMKGMQYLFKLGIIHRDIKPGNILYDGKSWKIADFGFSLQSKQEIRTRNNVGTPLYMPIQSLQKNLYSPQSDIFSLGVLFYELLIGITPWQCRDQQQLMRKLKKVQFKIPQKFSISNPIKELLTKLCQPLRQNRMNKKQFCLLNSIEIKRSSIQAALLKKTIIHQPQKDLNLSSANKDLPKIAFNLESSLQQASSSVIFRTQNNFFATGKMKKSSQNTKIQTNQFISKIKSTSNLVPKLVTEKLNAEENQAGQSVLINENYQKFNKNILLSMLNFCRFMFYLMKNASFLELNECNRLKIKFILIKHSMFLLKQLSDTKKNWFGLQGYESYIQTKNYYKIYASFQDYLSKYEKQYHNILRKIDEQTLRQVNQKIPEWARDDIHYNNQSFYRRLVSFIAPILRQNNHNLGLEILHKKKPLEETKQKIEAIKNFLKYYRLIETLSKQGGLYQLQSNQIQVVKTYQETTATIQQFIGLRKQMKYI